MTGVWIKVKECSCDCECMFLNIFMELKDLRNIPKHVRYMCLLKEFSPNFISTPGNLKNFPQFSFLPRVPG